MRPSDPSLRKHPLDDLVISAFAPASKAAPDDEDPAVTQKFVRGTAPYERIEIEPPRRRRYAHTVKVKALDTGWFAKSDESLTRIEEPVPDLRPSWWWLPLSLAVALVVLALVAL